MNKLGGRSSMKNKMVDESSLMVDDGACPAQCEHTISPRAESWGGYMRYWCEPCFCSVVPPVPWSEIIEADELYNPEGCGGPYVLSDRMQSLLDSNVGERD